MMIEEFTKPFILTTQNILIKNEAENVRRKIKAIFEDGSEQDFNFISQVYEYFKSFGVYEYQTIVNCLLDGGTEFYTNGPEMKKLNNIRLEWIEESPARIIIVNGVDRAGKDTLINEIDRQTKYKHMTMDRGPESFQAYCEIFKKGEPLKDYYKKMELELAKNPNVLSIYIDCETSELERRCVETDHEILDFDYHKFIMEKFFDEAEYMNKVKVDTTFNTAEEIVRGLISRGLI